MAGSSYKYNDIISQDVEKGFKDLAKLADNIHKSLTTIKIAPNTGEGLKSVNKELKLTNNYTKSLTSLNKQRLATEKKQETARKKELAQQNKLNVAYQRELAVKREKELSVKKEAKAYAIAKKDAKELIILKNKEVKSEKELIRYTNLLVKKRKEMVILTKKDALEHKKLTAEIKKNTIALKQSDASIERHQRNVGKYGLALKGLFQTFATGFGAMAVFSFLKKSTELFQIQEQAVKDNEAVFGSFSKTLQNAAADIQKVTTVGDEQSIALMTQAKNFGIANGQTIEATKGAIGLAEKFKKAGLGQETALKGIALAYTGNFSQLERYIPSLRTASTETEKMAILQEQMASGFNLSKEAAKTSGGQLKQFKNEIGDIQEKVGEGLVPVLKGLLKIAKITLKEMGKSYKDLITIFDDLVIIFGNWISLFKQLRDLFPSAQKGSNIFWKSLKKSLMDLVNPLGNIIDGVKTLIGYLKTAMLYLGLVKGQVTVGGVKNKQGKNGGKDVKAKSTNTTNPTNTTNHTIQNNPDLSNLVTGDAGYGFPIPTISQAELDNTIEDEMSKIDAKGKYFADMLNEYRKTWLQKQIDTYKQSGLKGVIANMFGVSDKDAQIIINQTVELAGKIKGLINQQLENERAIAQERAEMSEQRINELQSELNAEEEKLNKSKELGAAYDVSKQEALKKALAEEKKEKEKALAEEKKIKQKQKAMDIISINIKGALAIVNAWSSGTWIENIIESAGIAAITAVQLATVKNAKYAEGTNYVQLNGNKPGIDTVPAMLDAGERVVPKRDNSNIPLNFPNSELPVAVNYYLNRKGETMDEKGNIIMLSNENDLYLKKIEKNTRNGKVYSNGILISEQRGISNIRYN